MDDPNITMKEYIRLEEEKARRHGKVYNWETATYGRIWDNEDVHDLGSIDIEIPAIVFNNTLTSEAALSCEPTVSSLNDEIEFRISFNEFDDEDCTICASVYGSCKASGARVAFKDEFGAAEEREVSCEAQQGQSGVKRKLFGSCRNNMGNEPILALPEGLDNFVVMRRARTGGQSKRTFQTLKSMFRACVRNLVVVGILTFREAEIGESKMIGLELEQETTKGKLEPRYVGSFKILERIGPVAYRLRLPEELSGVHDMFHVSNLKKCLADTSLHVPLDEIKVDKTLRFVEEPVEIMDHEVKRLKRSRISLVKVRWNFKRGPKFTWEREDFMKSKYPQLFVDRADEKASLNLGTRFSKRGDTVTTMT
nr:putative reverse transcriptase domain-containing protein [Tanacetum cinerariifolium]